MYRIYLEALCAKKRPIAKHGQLSTMAEVNTLPDDVIWRQAGEY